MFLCWGESDLSIAFSTHPGSQVHSPSLVPTNQSPRGNTSGLLECGSRIWGTRSSRNATRALLLNQKSVDSFVCVIFCRHDRLLSFPVDLSSCTFLPMAILPPSYPGLARLKEGYRLGLCSGQLCPTQFNCFTSSSSQQPSDR